MTAWRLLCAVLALTFAVHADCSAQATPLRIDAKRIGISKMIPTVGDDITLKVPAVNPTEEPASTTCRLVGRAAVDGGPAAEFGAGTVDIELAPGEARDLELSWRPEETGFYELTFELSAAGSGRPRRARLGPVAVVAHDLYFAWFGAPKEFRWCNVPTTVKDGEIDYWLRRGAIPCRWRGAACYKDWALEKFVEHYGSSRWIGIDEIGGPGEDTSKFIAALREVRKAQPDHFAAVWFMGAHDYWADVTDVVDLFIPEVYLNYRGNHLGQFDSYLAPTRRAGVLSQTLFGLGINVIRDKDTKEPRVSPTKGDVLRQIRYIKRLAPNMPGVAFFTAYSAAEGVAEYADALCGEYFVKPVATIPERRLTIQPGKPPRLTLSIANYGGMTARDVGVHLTQRCADGRLAIDRTARIDSLPAGERREMSARIAPVPGISMIAAEIAPAEQHSLLDAHVEEPFCPRRALPDELRSALALVHLPPWGDGRRTNVPVSWTLNGDHADVRVVELEDSGSMRADVPSLTLTEEGRTIVRWVATDTTEPGQRRFYALLPGPQVRQKGIPLECEQADGRLRIRGPHYRAQIDTRSDSIVSLVPAGADTELLQSPWLLSCPGHEEFGDPQVARSDGWAAVTVPFESDLAAGRSRYIFSAHTPAIEISRVVRPAKALTVAGAGDRCGLAQRGGTYALQPGVGGVVSRGALRDSSEYRDLLYGYLGGSPTERNAHLAGWLDFSFDARWSAGLGVAIAERWRDAKFRSYDVTRLYDASDWIEVAYVWGTETTIESEQRSRLFLVPHGFVNMQEAPVPPARAIWETVHQPLRRIAG